MVIAALLLLLFSGGRTTADSVLAEVREAPHGLKRVIPDDGQRARFEASRNALNRVAAKNAEEAAERTAALREVSIDHGATATELRAVLDANTRAEAAADAALLDAYFEMRRSVSPEQWEQLYPAK